MLFSTGFFGSPSSSRSLPLNLSRFPVIILHGTSLLMVSWMIVCLLTTDAPSTTKSNIFFSSVSLQLQQNHGQKIALMGDYGYLDMDASKHFVLEGNVSIRSQDVDLTARRVQLGLSDMGVSLLSPKLLDSPFPIQMDELILSQQEEGIICEHFDVSIFPPWNLDHITRFSSIKVSLPLQTLSRFKDHPALSNQTTSNQLNDNTQSQSSPTPSETWRFQSQKATFYQSKVFMRANFEIFQMAHDHVIIKAHSARLKDKPLRISMKTIQVASGESAWAGEDGFFNLENGELTVDRVTIMDLIP